MLTFYVNLYTVMIQNLSIQDVTGKKIEVLFESGFMHMSGEECRLFFFFYLTYAH